jgi:SAM-dependent methyltransferase
MNCPLCLSSESQIYDHDKLRSYYQCKHCSLIYVPRDFLISPDAEKERYDSHKNDEDDSGYINYLNNISQTIKKYLSSEPQSGLDFGCGKTTMLAKLLNPHEVKSYDLYFHPRDELLNAKYDFIVLSEVIEHLRDPRSVMLKLKSLLKKRGQIFIKTKLSPKEPVEFSTWFYKRDITHIQFFNQQSLDVLSQICELQKSQEISEDLFLFKG